MGASSGTSRIGPREAAGPDLPREVARGGRKSSFGLRLPQVVVQRRVIPGQFQVIGEALHAPEEGLAECMSMILIGGVTVIDAAAEGAGLACGATALEVLPGAGL